MPFYSVQFQIFPTSNVAADATSNTWMTEADDLTAAEDFKDELIIFYNAVQPYLPDLVRQNGHVWKIVDLNDPQPQYPQSEGTFNFTSAPTGTPMPPEVALCVSFQGVRTPGQFQARRRGRIYLGPLRSSILASTGRPLNTVIGPISTAAANLLAASNSSATWKWSVFSRVNGGMTPVDNGWMDDEFDTQRRRGRLPVVRTTF